MKRKSQEEFDDPVMVLTEALEQLDSAYDKVKEYNALAGLNNFMGDDPSGWDLLSVVGEARNAIRDHLAREADELLPEMGPEDVYP